MRHHRVEEWETRLNELLKQVDHALEDEYGHLFAVHPARPQRGMTANPQHDGLFRVTASFSPGFGSELGRVWELDLVTLKRCHGGAERIQKKAVSLIQDGLERVARARSDGTARW